MKIIWKPKLEHWKPTKTMFNLIFEVFDLQRDGTILLALNVLNHGFKIEIPFNYSSREEKGINISWRLFRN